MLAIVNAKILTPLKIIDPGTILIKNHSIVAVGYAKEVPVPPTAKVIDIHRKIVVPGFIDLHIHGSHGFDVADGSAEALHTISKNLVQYGVTSFLPTVADSSLEEILKVIKITKKIMHSGTEGAQILGLNLEGPYLNPTKKGSMYSDYFRLPSQDEINQLLKEGESVIKMITLAPELKGAIPLISLLKEKGIVVSGGHSNATYSEAMNAFKKGMNHVTHIFNAMRKLHHREPGIVGAALAMDDVNVEIIADGFHLHPAIIKIITRVKGIERVILITDAVRAVGLSEGVSYLRGKEVVNVKNGVVQTKKGVLAGSILTMDKAVRNMIQFTGLSLGKVIQMCTLNPARAIKVDAYKGTIQEGKDADLVVLNEDYKVCLTLVAGNIVYTAL